LGLQDRLHPRGHCVSKRRQEKDHLAPYSFTFVLLLLAAALIMRLVLPYPFGFGVSRFSFLLRIRNQ
jgi:hypothetical protein